MQLKRPDRRRQLALAALTLIGGGAHGPAAAASNDPASVLATQLDSGLLWYQESDNRIRDIEAVVNVRQPLTEDTCLLYTSDAADE